MNPDEFNTATIEYINSVTKTCGFKTDFTYVEHSWKENVLFFRIIRKLNYDQKQWFEFLTTTVEDIVTRIVTHSDYYEGLREDTIFHYTRWDIIESFEKWYNPIFPHNL
jgi:hypothetical protein